MPVGNFQVLDEAIEALANAQLGDLDGVGIAAVLVGSGYTPNLATHATYSDISANEISGGDYAQVAVTGAVLSDISGGVRFDTGDITWGNPVTIPACKYLALVVGTAGSLGVGARVIGIQDLDTGGGTVESINAEFTVQAPTNGWFDITRQ